MRPDELVERALATAAGTPDVAGTVVIVTDSDTAVLRWANNSMTTNGHSTARRWSVISLVSVPGGTAAGVVSSGSAVTDAAEISELVRASQHAARQSGPARDAAPLPEPDVTADDWSEPAERTSVAVFAGIAEQLAEAFARAPGAHRLLYGFASHEWATTWLGTSTGVRRRWARPTGSIELNAKTVDPARSAWTGRSTRDFSDVELTALTDELGRRLGWGARRVELPAGRYPTILPPSAVADLMTFLAASMGGRTAQEGRSALSAPPGRSARTRVGERLSPLPLTLTSDPTAPGCEYEPFLVTTDSGEQTSVFDNGAPRRRVDWIRDGLINELAYPRADAAEFGTEFTPPGENLLLTGGSSASVEALVAGIERGLLLTCLWYIRLVDPATMLLTGLTRDGVYLVENGEVVGEVNNFRFNESPLDLLRRATEAGASERTLPREFKDWFTRAVMPPVLVPDFNMSSVSQAS